MSGDDLHRLIKAVKRADLDAIKSLIDAGVDIDGYNKQGLTPLCIAAGKGNAKVLRMLMDAGADLNKLSRTGIAPLSWAVCAKQNKAAELLREAGAKREEVDPFEGFLKKVYPETLI